MLKQGFKKIGLALFIGLVSMVFVPKFVSAMGTGNALEKFSATMDGDSSKSGALLLGAKSVYGKFEKLVKIISDIHNSGEIEFDQYMIDWLETAKDYTFRCYHYVGDFDSLVRGYEAFNSDHKFRNILCWFRDFWYANASSISWFMWRAPFIFQSIRAKCLDLDSILKECSPISDVLFMEMEIVCK